MKTKIEPIGDRILVKPAPATKSTGLIIIPDAHQERPQEATVVALGTGKVTDDGKTQPFAVKVGDRVIVARYSGNEIKVDGEEFKLVASDDVLAKVNQD